MPHDHGAEEHEPLVVEDDAGNLEGQILIDALQQVLIGKGLLTAPEDESDGVIRVDVAPDGSRVASDEWVPPSSVRASEPVPAAGPEDRADPWVLTLCHDDERDASFLAVLDGGRLAEGPVAKLWFDHYIPETFHGNWMPARA